MAEQVSSHQNDILWCLNNINICTVGIAVDWINDKIYLTVSRKIIKFDPKIKSTTTIVALTDATPRGIGVFPHKSNT